MNNNIPTCITVLVTLCKRQLKISQVGVCSNIPIVNRFLFYFIPIQQSQSTPIYHDPAQTTRYMKYLQVLSKKSPSMFVVNRKQSRRHTLSVIDFHYFLGIFLKNFKSLFVSRNMQYIFLICIYKLPKRNIFIQPYLYTPI